MLLAELIIPLVIFFVLVGIRLREEPRTYDTLNSYKHPLPSAGLLPFLNKFCPHGENNRVSIFANFIEVLSTLHKNNTLVTNVQQNLREERPSNESVDNLTWIQNDVGDFSVLNSGITLQCHVVFN